MKNKKIGVSACLLGIDCKYNGKNNKNESVLEYVKDMECIEICPESYGGLPTPRVPSEIEEGKSGEDFIKDKENFHVYSKEAVDVTDEFIRGAKIALEKLKSNGVEEVIMKESSPSCGVNKIYAGKFDGSKKNGMGVTAALFKENGIKMLSEKDIESGKNF